MERRSLWLGGLRRPMRLLTIGLLAALGLVWLWMLVGVMFLGSDTSMSSLLRPGDHYLAVDRFGRAEASEYLVG